MNKFLIAALTSLLVSTGFAQQKQADSLKTVHLNEVSVMATRTDANLKNIPQKVEIINNATISTVPNANIAELLKRTTNLDIVQYPGMSAMIGMRGFSPSAHSRSYTLILINGNPSGTENLASINTEMIERIEVVKGPYSMLYGSDAMGGVINIITKKENEDSKGGNVSVSSGSFGNLQLNANVYGNLSNKTSAGMGFSHQEQTQDYRIGKSNMLGMTKTEESILEKASYGDVMKNSQSQNNNINAYINSVLNNKWTASAEAMYMFAFDVETPGNYWGTYTQSKKDVERINLYPTLKRKTQNNTFLVSPYFTNQLTQDYSDNSDTGFVSLKTDVKEYGFKMNDNQKFGKFNLLVGADVDVYDYGTERFSNKTTPTTPYNPDNKNIKSALLSQLSFHSNKLDANAGVRYNNIQYKIDANSFLNTDGGKNSYKEATPSVGLQYNLCKNLNLHTSAGTAFSVPDAFKMAGSYSVSEYFAAWDFWWIKNYKGNPDLKPESSVTFDAGLHYALPNHLIDIDASYFQTKHKDKIIEYNIADTTSFKNANNSDMNGIELVFSSNLGALMNNVCKLELYANFTYMLNNSVDETLISALGADSIVTRDMLYTRKCNGNFGIYYDSYKGFSTRLHARYIGSRLERDNFSSLRPDITTENYYAKGGYTSADKILKHPDYLVFDYSVYYTIKKNRFGITVSNLFDENYSEKDGYNMPGRMIIGSFAYGF